MLEVDAFILSKNRAEFIGDSIKSLLLQSHPLKNLVVLDNQSSDNTETIVSGFSTVGFFKSSQELTVFDNLRRIKQYGNSDWVMAFHDDDLIHKSFLEEANNALKKYPNLNLICSNFIGLEFPILDDLNDQKLGNDHNYFANSSALSAFCMSDNRIGFSSCLYRREALNEVIDKDYSAFGKMADRPVLIQACGNGAALAFKESFLLYRLHAKQDSVETKNGPFLTDGVALANFYKSKTYDQGHFLYKLSYILSIKSFLKQIYKWCSDRESTSFYEFIKTLQSDFKIFFLLLFFPRPILRYVRKSIRIFKHDFF